MTRAELPIGATSLIFAPAAKGLVTDEASLTGATLVGTLPEEDIPMWESVEIPDGSGSF